MKEYIVHVDGGFVNRLTLSYSFTKLSELFDIQVCMASGKYPDHEEYIEFGKRWKPLPQNIMEFHESYKRRNYEKITCCGAFSDTFNDPDVTINIRRDNPTITMWFYRDYQGSSEGNEQFIRNLIDAFRRKSSANVFFYQSRVI